MPSIRGTIATRLFWVALEDALNAVYLLAACYKWHLVGLGIFFSLSSMSQAIAAPISFSGADIGALSLSAMPNSVAASNAFNAAAAALGTIQSIDFESSYPTGPQTSLLLAPGVTLSTTMATFTISASTSSQFVYAFNTTPGGSFYAGLTTCVFGLSCSSPAVYTFTFATPIEAFGLYITGRGQSVFGPQELSFNDPLSR